MLCQILLPQISTILSAASFTSWLMGLLSMPIISKWFCATGKSSLRARDEATAAAICGVISPSMELGSTMPMGPTITSAVCDVTHTAFSPAAPRFSPAFSIAAVAKALVPSPISSVSCGKRPITWLMTCA